MSNLQHTCSPYLHSIALLAVTSCVYITVVCKCSLIRKIFIKQWWEPRKMMNYFWNSQAPSDICDAIQANSYTESASQLQCAQYTHVACAFLVGLIVKTSRGRSAVVVEQKCSGRTSAASRYSNKNEIFVSSHIENLLLPSWYLSSWSLVWQSQTLFQII